MNADVTPKPQAAEPSSTAGPLAGDSACCPECGGFCRKPPGHGGPHVCERCNYRWW